MEKCYKGRALKPMKQNPSKKGSIKRGSTNRKRRLDGQRNSSTRRSKRHENCNTKEKENNATILSWLIDSQIVPESATIYYTGATTQAGFKKGTLERNGILCTCCHCIFTIRDFHVHAGGKVCDDPYEVIGIDRIRGDGMKVNKLHQELHQEGVVPDEPYYCAYCACKICGMPVIKRDSSSLSCSLCEKQYHVKCSNESLTIDINRFPRAFCDKSCRKVHEKLESKIGMKRELQDGLSWTLLHRFDKEYGSYEVMASKRLECYSKLAVAYRLLTAYHVKCSNESLTIDVNRFPRAFCDKSCRKVHEKLESKIGMKRELQDGLSWTLLHRFDKEYGSYEVMASKRLECYSKLAVAYRLLTACFEPIKDRHTRINMIRNVVYNCGSHYQRINFSSFFTGILEKGDEIIAVATIRIHGTNLAEIPFIATAERHRNKGMCGKLLNGIEHDLRDFGVSTMVIPSSSETIRVWNEKYGFQLLSERTKKQIMKLNTLMFHDCIRMQKTVTGYPNSFCQSL
ncbi:increased DNA methylation 1 [Artemisia annua]|uniref:Increased DNA methylation 1 n=1 Tax=Artemisia annua TaxID=35608 RepID=A0A2U1Q4P5_ARTAN|nr:increased DNA methylation 1 [Artemisia annua]